jgi:hypothetical protein
MNPADQSFAVCDCYRRERRTAGSLQSSQTNAGIEVIERISRLTRRLMPCIGSTEANGRLSEIVFRSRPKTSTHCVSASSKFSGQHCAIARTN